MPSSSTAAVMARLGDAGRKTTRARARVVAATLRRHSPFSAEEVAREVARAGVGRATVFRTLDLLVSIGALSRVHGIEDGGRCVRYTPCAPAHHHQDRKSTRLNSSHSQISYAVFCLKKKKTTQLLLACN